MWNCTFKCLFINMLWYIYMAFVIDMFRYLKISAYVKRTIKIFQFNIIYICFTHQDWVLNIIILLWWLNNSHSLLTYHLIFVSKISIFCSLLFQVLVSNSSAQLLVSNEYLSQNGNHFFHHSVELLKT